MNRAIEIVEEFYNKAYSENQEEVCKTLYCILDRLRSESVRLNVNAWMREQMATPKYKYQDYVKCVLCGELKEARILASYVMSDTNEVWYEVEVYGEAGLAGRARIHENTIFSLHIP